MTITTPSAQPFSTDKHINAAAKGITASERKLLVSVNDEIQRLNGIAGKFQPERMGQSHPLDGAIEAARVLAASELTFETARDYHELKMVKLHAKESTRDISEIYAGAARIVIDTLIPIAVGIIDRAEESFFAEAEAHKEATRTQTSFATATADFEARLEGSRQAFKAKRKWITEENASAHFLILELGLLA